MPREKKAALRKQYREKFTFVGSDLNKDGHLDRDEWRNYTWNFYLIADVDGDGKLSYAEHISLEVPVTSQGDVWRLDVVEAERVVRRRDKNRDGFITSNEYRKHFDYKFDSVDAKCKKDGWIVHAEFANLHLVPCPAN